jgi:hypothetical protein
MPLIILGLIVVLGAALLIYYQLGPKVTLRLRSRQSGFGGFGGAPEDDASADVPGDEGSRESTDSDLAEDGKKASESDGKVLFIFGDGESEERPIREDDKPRED